MRPLWFGSFVNSFKNKTGVEPDFNKIKENDEAYMDTLEYFLKKIGLTILVAFILLWLGMAVVFNGSAS
jgi:hypothetical protein